MAWPKTLPLKPAVRSTATSPYQEVAKSIAVLQILGNLPITVETVASLMHPSVDGASRLEPVRQAVEAMLQEPRVPLSEKEGELSFLSEKLREIDVERSQIALRSVDVRSILKWPGVRGQVKMAVKSYQELVVWQKAILNQGISPSSLDRVRLTPGSGDADSDSQPVGLPASINSENTDPDDRGSGPVEQRAVQRALAAAG